MSETTPDDVVGTIPIQGNTLRFYQGVATGSRIVEEHAEVEFPDDRTRSNLFWFYAGAIAADEHGCKTSEDFTFFARGAATRAPSLSDVDRRVLSAVKQWKDSDFYNAFGFERDDDE